MSDVRKSIGAANALIDTATDLVHVNLPIPQVLQQIAKCCRKGGWLSIPGMYAGFVNMFAAYVGEQTSRASEITVLIRDLIACRTRVGRHRGHRGQDEAHHPGTA